MNTSTLSASSLAESYAAFREANPKTRIRQAAAELNTSEAELLLTGVGAEITPLNTNFQDLLKAFSSLGYVMSLTRNEACVLEHKGAFEEVKTFGRGAHNMGVVLGPIETRVFFTSWHAAFAVTTRSMHGNLLQSIQVFDQAGEAVTKVYLTEQSNAAAYAELVNTFKVGAPENITFPGVKPTEYSTEINTNEFLAEWEALKDTHDFFGMLRKHGVQRREAMRLAEGKFTKAVDPQKAVQFILKQASARKLPIMIFAGNRGNLQIHQDKVRTIRFFGEQNEWINVLDPAFNLHLRLDLLKEAWLVEKPTTDGAVHSLECYDPAQELVVQFFGLRKPGIPQSEDWYELIQELSK